MLIGTQDKLITTLKNKKPSVLRRVGDVLLGAGSDSGASMNVRGLLSVEKMGHLLVAESMVYRHADVPRGTAGSTVCVTNDPFEPRLPPSSSGHSKKRRTN